MAGTVTIDEEGYSTIKKIAFAWTSAADGTATGTTTDAYSGEVLRLVTKPGAGGDQPTDLYDVVINDQDTVDVLSGVGANRSNTVTEQAVSLAPALGVVANDKLSLSVSGAGNAKSGTAILYIR